jgi:HK97 gp10 family phage protein
MAEFVVVISDARANAYGPRYLRYKGKGIEELAKWGAPKRTGHMARNINRGMVTQMGAHAEVEVIASAHYASYVHQGTKRIKARGKGMSVPKYKWPASQAVRRKRKSVRGQKSQPFLTDAMVQEIRFSRFVMPL